MIERQKETFVCAPIIFLASQFCPQVMVSFSHSFRVFDTVVEAVNTTLVKQFMQPTLRCLKKIVKISETN